MSDEFLERASDVAFARLDEAGGDPARLAEPYRTVALVCAAQAVIDNGGLGYLFENDWPGQPPYALFVEAYRAIGAQAEAAAIEEASKLFVFPDPERHEARRRRVLEGAVGEWLQEVSAGLEGDVWALVARYAREHADAFSDGPPLR